MADPAPLQQPAADLVPMYTADGQEVAVPAAEARDRFQAGELGFLPSQTVTLRDETGALVPVSGAEAAARMGSYQTQVVGRDTLEEERLRERVSDPLSQAAAFGAGGLRALTFGLSDRALIGLGGEDARQNLRDLQRFNPNLSMAGEVAGMVAPALVSGGALSLGGLVERGGARALARAGVQAEGSALARTGLSMAGQALEMGALSAGQEVSRAALANENLTGERMFSAFGHGALLGAGGAAALGAGAALVRGVAGKTLDVATSLAQKATGRTAAGAAERATTLGEKAARLADTVLPGGVEGYAAQKSLTSTGATQKMLGDLDRAGEAVKARVVRQIEEDLPRLLGKEKNAILSRAELAEAAVKNTERIGQEIGDSLASLDRAATKVRPDAAAIVKEARATILKDLQASPFSQAQAGQMAAKIDDFERLVVDPTFSGLHEQRRLLDRAIRFEAQAPTVGQEALRDFRSIIEKEIERSAEVASKEVGGNFAATYKAAKEQYRAAAWLEKAAEKGAEREGAAASMGLREMLGAVGGSNVGSAVGGAIAGPVGAAVGGIGAGLASAYMNNLAKRYGDQAVASLLHRAKGLDPVAAAFGLLEEITGKSVAAFLRRSGEKSRDVTRAATTAAGLGVERYREAERERAARYQAARQAVAAAKANPQALRARVKQALPPGMTPAMQLAAQQTAERGAAYLAKVAPRPPVPVSQSFTPHLEKTDVSPDAQRRFLAAVEAVDDPLSVLRGLERGEQDRDAIEAVRAVHPETFASWQRVMQAQLSERTEPLSYEQARDLSILFGVVGHPALAPSFGRAIQQTFTVTTTTSQPPGAPPAAPRRPVRVASAYDLDRSKEF